MAEKKVVYIGIDPGKEGFITAFDGQNHDFYPMPKKRVETGNLTKTGKPEKKTVFDERGLLNLALQIRLKYKDFDVYVAIEKVTGRNGWSAENNFNFGQTKGLQKMLSLIVSKNEVLEVRPQKWQAFMRQGYREIKMPSQTGKTMVLDAKAIAEMIVQKEWPNIDFRKSSRASKNDDNKIDSFLICMYLYRIMNQ